MKKRGAVPRVIMLIAAIAAILIILVLFGNLARQILCGFVEVPRIC